MIEFYNNKTSFMLFYAIDNKVNMKSVFKTYDAWGGIKTSIDPENSVSYTYKSVGKPDKIIAGRVTFSMTYNNCGLQDKLTDPDAGITG